MYTALSLLLILSSAKTALSQTPAFDPREWKGTQAQVRKCSTSAASTFTGIRSWE